MLSLSCQIKATLNLFHVAAIFFLSENGAYGFYISLDTIFWTTTVTVSIVDVLDSLVFWSLHTSTHLQRKKKE